MQLLDVGGGIRQPFVQSRACGEKTGLPLPKADAFCVVTLDPWDGDMATSIYLGHG